MRGDAGMECTRGKGRDLKGGRKGVERKKWGGWVVYRASLTVQQ